MNKKQTRYGVFYRSNGRWSPFRTWTGKQRIFTSTRELGRFVNSNDFASIKNYILKSRVTVRKLRKAA
jgi:hypothetical protein